MEQGVCPKCNGTDVELIDTTINDDGTMSMIFKCCECGIYYQEIFTYSRSEEIEYAEEDFGDDEEEENL